MQKGAVSSVKELPDESESDECLDFCFFFFSESFFCSLFNFLQI